MNYGTMSEITLFAADFRNDNPRGWNYCSGQIENISGHEALNTLLGTRHGGNGRQTFGVPHLDAAPLLLKKGYGNDALKFIMCSQGTFPSVSSFMGGYVGMIKMMASDVLPKDWAYCDGQLLPIASNQALFDTIGTKYGGDGTTNFALPKLNANSLCSNGTAPKFVIAKKTHSSYGGDDPEFGMSQVVLFGGDTPPSNWAFCDGQEMGIGDNSALFSLVGTCYGGDGRTKFGLPKMDVSSISEGTGCPKAIICTEGLFPSRA
ncbi:MAG: tail fiber protein [Chitinophagales bacterium]